MDLNGIEIFEGSNAERRSPRGRYISDAMGVDRKMQLHGPVDEDRRYETAKALIGYAVMRSEIVAGVTRRWIERGLPASWTPPTDVDLNPEGIPCLYLASVPLVQPRNSKTDAGVDEAGAPLYLDGAWIDTQYAAYPFWHKDDTSQLAVDGPLSAGTPAGALARPDEGYWLAQGWGNSRYIVRDIKHAPRTVTIAGSTLRYAEGDLAGKDVPGAQQFSQYRGDVKYVWLGVPYDAVPHLAIGFLSDRVNDAQLDFMQTGTAKFSGSDIRTYRGPLGNMLCDLTYSFQYLPNYSGTPAAGEYKGWNAIPARTADGTIDYVYVSADGMAPTGANNWFRFGDMTALFRPRQN